MGITKTNVLLLSKWDGFRIPFVGKNIRQAISEWLETHEVFDEHEQKIDITYTIEPLDDGQQLVHFAKAQQETAPITFYDKTTGEQL